MTAGLVALISVASPTETAAIDAACAHVAGALTQASSAPWRVTHNDPNDAAAIRLIALGPEVERDEPWAATEARLRAQCQAWSALPLFIATVLRHVEGPDAAARQRRLVRIRRLNLLAAQLSQETGAFVIDLDRTLADLGAQRLSTDWRLDSEAARDQASKCIAVSLIANGLDQLASFELQDQASAIMAEYQPALGLPPQLRPQQLVAIGRGRRRQVAAVEAGSAEQRHLFLIRQILARQIGPVAAAAIFVRAVRHVGLRQSLVLLSSAVRRLVGARG